MTITQRVAGFIKENNMLHAGEAVCVGLSGGADSVFLLQALFELRKPLGIRVCAFHVNHNLRGAESESDEAYVRRFCEERSIPCRVFSYDIAALAKEERKGLEETGRLMRRKAAQNCLDDGFADRIALAHHMNDRAETVLFHLARGSSLSGLAGILPVNDRVIRPLLFLKREEIETALKERGIPWCTDSTNLYADCTRNRIRLQILPMIAEQINPQSIVHIAEAAQDLELADRLIAEMAEKKREELTETRDGEILLRPALLSENRLLAGYVILDALKKLSGSATDLTRRIVRDLTGLLSAQTGRRLDLPYGLTAVRGYEGVLLKKKELLPELDNAGEAVLEIGAEVCFNKLVFRAELAEKQDLPEPIPKKTYTKWFDYDKMAGCLLRFRRKGDYLITDARMHRKKLKDYLIDEKIPAEQRDRLVCLASGSLVHWVVGYRIGEDCRVTENTQRVLKITVSGGETDGREYQDSGR